MSAPTDWSAFSKTLLNALDPWQRGAGATKEDAMVADDLSAVIVGTKVEIKFAATAFFKVLGEWATRYGMKISKKTTAIIVSAPKASDKHKAWIKSAKWKCQDVEIKAAKQMKLFGYVLDITLSLGPAVDLAVRGPVFVVEGLRTHGSQARGREHPETRDSSDLP